MGKTNKKNNSTPSIVELMTELDKKILQIKKYTPQLDGLIDDAGKKNQKVLAMTLIRQKTNMNKAIQSMEVFKIVLRSKLLEQNAASMVGPLQKALSSCLGNVSSKSDFKKISKSMSMLTEEINNSRSFFQDFSDSLTQGGVDPLLAGVDDTDPLESASDEELAEYQAMLDRIAKDYSNNDIENPSVKSTRNLDIEDLIKQENKK